MYIAVVYIAPAACAAEDASGLEVSLPSKTDLEIDSAFPLDSSGSPAARKSFRARTVDALRLGIVRQQPRWLLSGLLCTAILFILRALAGNSGCAHLERIRGAASEWNAGRRGFRGAASECEGGGDLPREWLERVKSTSVSPGRTHVFCSDDYNASSQPGGADITRRSCMVHNACLDHNDRWIFYTGADAPPPAPSAPLCIGAACDDQPFVYRLPLRYDSSIIRPRVISGSPVTVANDSSSGRVRWIDASTPVFLQERHRPDNHFHSVRPAYLLTRPSRERQRCISTGARCTRACALLSVLHSSI